jgi:hypothetical protein
MNCEGLRSTYELYVFGTAEPADRAELEAHLAQGCKACAESVARSRWLARYLALTVPEEKPPEDLRSDVLRAITLAKPKEVTFWQTVLWRLGFPVSAIGAIALLIICIGLFTEVRSVNREAESLKVAAAKQRDRELQLLYRLAWVQSAVLRIPTAGTKEVRFGSKQFSGRAYLHPHGLLLVAADLPKPPLGRVYQLWLYAKSDPAPAPAGVFEPDSLGHALHLWEESIAVETMRQIAVTEEPPGGLTAPSGKVLFSAQVK